HRRARHHRPAARGGGELPREPRRHAARAARHRALALCLRHVRRIVRARGELECQPPAVNPVSTARGVSRLAFDGIERLREIVEAMHANIAATPLPLGRGTAGRTRGITGLVYGSIRLVNAGVRAAVDGALAWLPAEALRPGPHAEAWLALLNGVMGDHLA